MTALKYPCPECQGVYGHHPSCEIAEAAMFDRHWEPYGEDEDDE